MQTTSVTRESLRRLSQLDAAGRSVLSLYLNLDPSETSTLHERHSEVDSLLEEAERRYLDNGSGLSHEARVGMRASVQRVREFLTDDELSPGSAHGLAIFCCVPADIFEVIALPRSVEPTVVVDERPFIEPLAELAVPGRWCALLISRRASRIFRGTRDWLVEVADVRDDVHRRHSQGGWSQSRYQRGIEKETDDHVRRTCELLFERFQHRPFDRLIIGGSSELAPRVERELHPDLRRHLAGHLEIDVERATPDEVHERAIPLIEADERRREDRALERLREGLAPDGHASTGLEEVLQLLNERRVETLLMAHGFTAAGAECPRCGLLATSGGPCPADGTDLQPQDDVVERAIEAALAQAAVVLVMRHRPSDLERQGSIAALARF